MKQLENRLQAEASGPSPAARPNLDEDLSTGEGWEPVYKPYPFAAMYSDSPWTHVIPWRLLLGSLLLLGAVWALVAAIALL